MLADFGADSLLSPCPFMLKLLGSIFAGSPSSVTATVQVSVPPPTKVSAPGAEDFIVTDHLVEANGLPVFDWAAAQQWVDAQPQGPAQGQAWSACERAWLEHLRAALGHGYQLREQGSALLLSTLQDNVCEATLAFMGKTLQRIVHVLDGVAQVSEWGHDILVLFDDEDTYYRYVAHYYPDAGEFAGSGGMYINAGCGHFVSVKNELRSIEPVIVHEMTHACLGHLPIPAWLNEGIAVNTEHRLCPPPFLAADPRKMHARHRAFWGPTEIQQFWSGKSFLRADEGNELSYDLARIIVAQFAASWDRFRRFVLAADAGDAGALAASQHLEVDLGGVVAALLEQPHSAQWSPAPASWTGTPERGAFCLHVG